MAFRNTLPFYLTLFGRHSAASSSLFTAHEIYSAIEAQVSRPEWLGVYESPNNFHSWFTLTLLHVWMALVRLRLEGKDGTLLADALFGFFWSDVERRLVALGFTNPLIFGKNLNVYTNFYFGAVIAYDEALNASDALLAEALWRNIFDLSADVSPRTLAMLVHYVRREIYQIMRLDAAAVFDGRLQFSRDLSPKALADDN
jgi:cytochrome b pre-mRNA-processing protein 3